MTQSKASARLAQQEQRRRPLQTPKIFHPNFVDHRARLDDDSDTFLVRFGLTKTDQEIFNAIRVEVTYDADDPRLPEVIDAMRLSEDGRYEVYWARRPILEADYKIEERPIKPSIKVDGVPYSTCKRVHELCSGDPAADISALKSKLASTRISKPKQNLIVKAYTAEAKARESDTPQVSRLIDMLVAAGEKRAKARELARDFNPALGPYQFLFRKRQSFLKADQFAKILDPKKRVVDRSMALHGTALTLDPNTRLGSGAAERLPQ